MAEHRARALARATPLVLCALALACSRSSDGAPPAAGPAPAPDSEARAHEGPWWDAVRRLDLDAARALDADPDRRAFLDALATAIEGGSAMAEEALCALATGAVDPLLRRRAAQTALNLLRTEARWEALADFGERCGVTLREGAVPPALLELRAEVLELPAEPVVLPLVQRGTPLPLVAAKASGPKGREELVALVDTGASACLLAADAAERLGVTVSGAGAIPILGSAGRGATARPATLPELRLGTLRATDLPVLILDDGALTDVLPDVALVVGWELLQHVAVEFDGISGEVVLRRSTPRPSDVPPNLVLLYEPVVRLESGGTPLLFLLDTGSTSSDATPGLVRRLGLRDLPRVRDETRGLGAAREGLVPEIPVLALELGGVSLQIGGMSVWAMPDEPNRLIELDGTLGADVALAGRLVVDGPARRVTLAAQ